MDPKFWQGKKVLLTGHTGFKGSWMSLWLQSMGAEVVGYSLAPPSKPSLFEVAKVAEGMTSIEGNVTDLDHLCRVFKEHQPEIVIHMAAQALVRPSYESPVETYASNVMGTVNVLEAVRVVGGVKAVLCVTSDKCYENQEWVWGYRENEPMGGYDPYSNSKGCSELVTSAYRRSFFSPANYQEHGVAVATGRAGNVIGGGDWALDRLVPDILRAIMEKETVIIRSPNAIRPWQHVLECLLGYLLLTEKLYEDGAKYAEGWNFGPSDEDARPVSWLVDHLLASIGNGASWQLEGEAQPHEANYLKLDCSKSKAHLGFKPRLGLDNTVGWIGEWYKAYMDKQDMRAVTLLQIKRYKGLGSL